MTMNPNELNNTGTIRAYTDRIFNIVPAARMPVQIIRKRCAWIWHLMFTDKFCKNYWNYHPAGVSYKRGFKRSFHKCRGFRLIR